MSRPPHDFDEFLSRPRGRSCQLRQVAISLVLTVFTAAAAQTAFAAGSEAVRTGHDLKLTVDWRWAGCANGGYYPIRIRVSNLARPRELEFRFIGKASDSKLPEVTRRIAIDQNATQQFSLPVPLVSSGSSYGELVVFEGGQVLESLTQSIVLPDAPHGTIDRPSLLVIAPQHVECSMFEEAVQYVTAVGGVVTSSGGGSISGFSFSGSGGGYSNVRSNDFQVIAPALLPESWIDYSGLDIVALSLATLDKIPAGARAAILNWVETGGTLLVYEVGEPAKDSKDLARLLDTAARSPAQSAWRLAAPADFKSLAFPGAFQIERRTRGRGIEIVNDLEREPKGAWTVDEHTYSRLDYLAGRIYAFRDNPFPGEPIDWMWWLNAARPQSLKWTVRNGLSSRLRHTEFFQFLIPGVGAVPVLAFVILISVFTIIIGPVNYFVVWRRRQLYLLVLTIPVIAFLTSCTLFGYAMVADGFGIKSRVRSVTLIDQYAKTAVSFNRLALYAGLAPSAGLRFSADTEVLPVWPSDAAFESGSVDWTNNQHLSSGWLRSRTHAQFATISHRAERGRINVRSAGPRALEVENGLEWPLDMLVVRDGSGQLFAAKNLAAGAAATLRPATEGDLQALRTAVNAYKLEPPPGVTPGDYEPIQVHMRRGYVADNSQPTAFAQGQLEGFLQRLLRPGQESALGGLPPQTWVAVSPQNPGIELGVERAKEVAGVHVLMGNY